MGCPTLCRWLRGDGAVGSLVCPSAWLLALPLSRPQLAGLVGTACQRLTAANVPHNLFIADCGARVFLFPNCFAEKKALGLIPEGEPTSRRRRAARSIPAYSGAARCRTPTRSAARAGSSLPASVTCSCPAVPDARGALA